MSKFSKYIDDSLASSGFVVINASVAYTMRSDLWSTGLECGHEFVNGSWRNRLAYITGLKKFHIRLPGVRGLVDVYSRSEDHLARRITWITGLEVLDFLREEEIAGVLLPSDAPPRVMAITGDMFEGVATAETGRTCTSCDRISSAGSCISYRDSGMQWPLINVPRRCLAYVPLWDASDARKGLQLWPELVHIPA